MSAHLISTTSHAYRDPPPAEEHAPEDERAIEIAYWKGSSLIDVQHIVRSGRRAITPVTYTLLGLAVVLLLTGAVIADAAVTIAEHIGQGMVAGLSLQVTRGYGWFAGASLAAGLVLVGVVAARLRREKQPSSFHLHFLDDHMFGAGTSPVRRHGRSQDVPLVTWMDDGFYLHFDRDMDGEVYHAGLRNDLSELVARGRALASSAVPGLFSMPIPPGARIRVRLGSHAFAIASVPLLCESLRPSLRAGSLRIGAYMAGLAVLNLGAWAAIEHIPPEPRPVAQARAGGHPPATLSRSSQRRSHCLGPGVTTQIWIVNPHPLGASSYIADDTIHTHLFYTFMSSEAPRSPGTGDRLSRAYPWLWEL